MAHIQNLLNLKGFYSTQASAKALSRVIGNDQQSYPYPKQEIQKHQETIDQ